MITFECDRCGYKEQYKGVVTHHMTFMEGGVKKPLGRKFEQLIPQLCTKTITDVCGKCFSEICKKRNEIKKTRDIGIFSKTKEFIEGGFK